MSFFLKTALLLTAMIATAHAKVTLLENVEIKWTPTTELAEIVTPLSTVSTKITIEKFKDARTVDPINKIGENKDDVKKGETFIVTTSTDMAQFATDNVTEIFKKSGFEVEDTAPLKLSGEITEFYVTETNRYSGSLIIKMSLSKKGKVIWKSVVLGNNSRFGRSYKLYNYQETFSDLVIDLMANLSKNTEFKDALKQK